MLTTGKSAMNGMVQASMQNRSRISSDFTGEENLRSALADNGSTGTQLDEALLT